MSCSPRQQANTSPEGSECTQLLQLLAQNPSAALKIFKFTSPSDEKPHPVQIYKGRRAKCTPRINNKLSFQSPPKAPCSSVRVYCLPPKFENSRTISETSQKPANPRNMHLLSEEIELKSKCVDDLGNFDFDALLPAIYWKCREDSTKITNDKQEES